MPGNVDDVQNRISETLMIEQIQTTREEILHALEDGITLVTGNNRLSAAVRQDYEQHAVNKGATVWPTPDILPWTAWLKRSWEDAVVTGAIVAPGRILSSEQELQVWEDIIGNSDQGHGLLRTSATARTAREAWRLLKAWRLDVGEALLTGNEDAEAFYAWAEAFTSRCLSFGWLTADEMSEQFATMLNHDSWEFPEALWVLGFDELTPAQTYILEALQRRCAVSWVRIRQSGGQTVRLACDDSLNEMDSLARWARSRLEANPKARIGIVATDLAGIRASLSDTLDRVLLPEVMKPGTAAGARPWNISLGLPLTEYPVIRSALLLLELLRGRLSIEKAGALLLSPHIDGAEQEAGARALLDHQLRRRGEPEISLSSLIFFAGLEGKPGYCPRLLKRLLMLHEAHEQHQGMADPVKWSNRFATWLKLGGWTLGRSLSSEEFQAVEKWRDLLSAFSGLEAVTHKLSLAEALSTLQRLAADSIFQPQSEEAPIQVLGLYEAMELRFDHLWVMGLHDEIWPPAPAPNPFLPLGLQRRHGMPRASQERELAVARQITHRLVEAADEVVFSYPKRKEAEALRPSPLILGFEEDDRNRLGLWQDEGWELQVHDSLQLEAIERDTGPVLEQHGAPGGSTLFRLQSLCPFRAFAELRLGARPLEEAQIGLDARQRGTLVHRVMELFWEEIQSQDRLMSLDEGELLIVIETQIDRAMEEMARLKPQAMTARFREVEKERLRRLVLEWLDIELDRAAFRVVGHEQKVTTEINGVGVRVQIDRIDALADGRKVLIDYKTGEVKPAQWFGERPDDPQLPLYSTILEGDIAAVLFGQIRAGGLAFNGIVADEEVIGTLPSNKRLKEVMENWQGVLGEWRDMLDRLAGDFKDGVAEVDPKQDATCDNTYCVLGPLCRIDEQRALNNQFAKEEEADD
jgi:ATP-dependent helicase/nuclease subunit B